MLKDIQEAVVFAMPQTLYLQKMSMVSAVYGYCQARFEATVLCTGGSDVDIFAPSAPLNSENVTDYAIFYDRTRDHMRAFIARCAFTTMYDDGLLANIVTLSNGLPVLLVTDYINLYLITPTSMPCTLLHYPGQGPNEWMCK